MMADIRMLQEQSQQLQNLLGVAHTRRSRPSTPGSTSRPKRTARRSPIRSWSSTRCPSDLRVVREKLDDNNVRIGSLTQEVDALRQARAAARAPRPSGDRGIRTPAGGRRPAAAGGAAAAAPPPARRRRRHVAAEAAATRRTADYTAGQYDLAITASRPTSRLSRSPNRPTTRRCYIGRSYLQRRQVRQGGRGVRHRDPDLSRAATRFPTRTTGRASRCRA